MMKIPDINAVRDWCIGMFAKKAEVPTKLSGLTNDKGFLTEMPAATLQRMGR